MTVEIRAARQTDMPAIDAFNQRLRQGDAGFELPASIPPRDEELPVWHEMFVAKEAAEIRGGYFLKHERLMVDGELLEVGNYQLPLSEGIVDRAHSMVGIQLLQHVMCRNTHLYCLGMGSMQRPLPRLLSRRSWLVEEVPFYFRVLHAGRFLKNINYLKDSSARRRLIALARYSGLGGAAVAGWRAAARMRSPRLPRGLSVDTVSSFGHDADQVFAHSAGFYGAIIERSADVLNWRFPSGDCRLIRLVVRSDERAVGWLVLTSNTLRCHKQFGSMRLGCIVDGLCPPELCGALISLGTGRLIADDVDLIVSNQSHWAWLHALSRSSYARGPSNFIFARSSSLAADTPDLSNWHLNRGDGDGPINL